MSFEEVEYTFQDVWTEQNTDQELVDYLVGLKLADRPLSKYYEKTGTLLAGMKEAKEAIVAGAPTPVQRFTCIEFFGFCAETRKRGAKKRRYDDHRRFKDLPTPSAFAAANASKDSWVQQQQKQELAIFCLRPAGKSFINVTLMNHVFLEIADILATGTPDAIDLKLQAELVATMPSGFALENARRDHINTILEKYIAIPLGLSIGVRGVSGTKDSDGSSGQDFLFFNVEYKNEKGEGHSDPYLQNAGYYVHYWASQKDAPSRHCCPWLMIEILGQEMGLSGAAFVCNHPCVQPLSSNVPFVDIPQGGQLKLMQGRLCMAIRIGFRRLHEWYSSSAAEAENDSQSQFPFQRSFKSDTTGHEVQISYEALLHDDELTKPIFRGRREDTKQQIVVKFTSSYGDDVHRHLGGKALAPKLYGVQKVSGITMVVMEYVEGAFWPNAPTDQQKKNIRAVQQELRDGGFVHGDLRPSNILVGDDFVKVLDFDWAGKQGETVYPSHLHPRIDWAPGAALGEKILFEHDGHMVEKLCTNPRSIF